MKRKIIYIEQYINTPCEISIVTEDQKYIIDIKEKDFNLKTSKHFYSTNNLYTCEIKGHILNENKRNDRSSSPIPSNIELDINNRLKLDTKTQLPTMCLDYLFIPTDNNYTRNDPLYVNLIIDKKVEKKSYILFWGLCICYLIWIYI